MENGHWILGVLVLVAFAIPALMIYTGIIESKAQQARDKALEAQFKYYYGEIPNWVKSDNFWKNKEKVFELLESIKRKHEMILNSQVSPMIKDEVNTLLNNHLFNLEKEILPILTSKTGYLKPDNMNGLTYKQIFVNNLQDISHYLDNLVNKQFEKTSLLNFNINNFTQANVLTTSASLIEPLQNKGKLLLESLSSESETYLVVKKLINEYLPQVAIDYQLSLNQPLTNVSRPPKQVFDDITEKVDKYFDDIKSGQNVATVHYQQDHYSNLLVFERYLKSREIT